jgi:hypothetical protein
MSQLDNSEVMSEFFKIASESKIDAPKPEDAKTIEDKVLEVDEDLVEEAHPEPVYVAEALGDGGLVENQNEQHTKMMDAVNKMPPGTIMNTNASCALELLKLAEECDQSGESEAADLITIMAEKVLEVPFV